MGDEQDIRFQLFQNVPNPFSGKTRISYSLESTFDINISIYDSSGRFIAELVNRVQNPGTYHVKFDATGLARGTYTCRMTAGNSYQYALMICK